MTFLEQLRAAREAATQPPWRGISSDHDLWHLTAGEITYQYGDSGLTWEKEIALDSRKAPLKDDIRDESYPGTLGKDFDLICLLVNNSEKLERLIEAAQEVDRQMAAAGEGWPDTGGIRGLKKALAALDREET